MEFYLLTNAEDNRQYLNRNINTTDCITSIKTTGKAVLHYLPSAVT